MSSSLPVEVIRKQDWLEPVADQLQPAIANTLNRGGVLGPKIANVLHGAWLGHPLHVALTDVPVGSWTAAAVLDLWEAQTGNRIAGRAADATVKIGLFGAVLSAVTGLADWSKIGGGEPRRVGLVHALLNTTATVCYISSVCARANHHRRAGRRYALLGFLVANASAYLGGHLVYSQQLGVDHTAGYTPPEDFIAVLADTDLADNQPKRVDAAGMPVLLVRKGERIYAIAETCSHLGGPLSEGTIEDTTVRCPWHGSCFSLQDGRVIEGPSCHAQPVLDVRVRDGQIEVRGSRP